MTDKKHLSRLLGLIGLFLSLILIICATPASAAFITITDCPTSVNQGAVLTISGYAPGLDSLKITLSSLSVQTFKPESFYINVDSDDSYFACIDTTSLPNGQYLVVVSGDSFAKGKEVTSDLMAKASFTVFSQSPTPSPVKDYSTPSPNEKETSGFNQGTLILGIILGVIVVVVVGGLILWVIRGARKQNNTQNITSQVENNANVEFNNSAKKYCTHCGAEIKNDYLFCQKCGTKIEKEETKVKQCPNCGAEVGDDYLFCLKCGKKL